MASFSKRASLQSPGPGAAPITSGPDGATGARPKPGRRLGWIVAGSVATGLIAASLFVAAPFVPVEESAITGAVLCGFAVGWAALLLLSLRFTDRPQRWAVVPAVFMGVGGLLLIIFGSSREVLSWVWPPGLFALVIWMFSRVRRDLPSRTGRVLLYAVLAVLALSSVGGGYETVREARDTTPFPSSGRLIDVGGHRLYLSCIGSGSPAVVLEPGAGGVSSDLGWITPAVAHETRVCVYDRAGRGWSESADIPEDGAQIAADLHTLLHRGGVRGPYVLAGHSFGGLYVRIFAARYPREVAGLVLVDSTASREPPQSVIPSAEDEDAYDAVDRAATAVSILGRLGVTALIDQLFPTDVPSPSGYETQSPTASASTVRSTAEEYLRGNAAMREAAALRDFGDKPLVILTAGEGHPDSWMEDQDETEHLSSNSVHRVVDGASHQAMIAEKQYAAATSRAVLEVVSSIRDNAPLAR